ncbi:MAG: signal recognition particle-docking protein FtsY [Candidatus Riflebacteria bacterium]|nr:signal recognition particle-docking protein FtsY [Candidatus Riflebacteria bacterium]
MTEEKNENKNNLSATQPTQDTSTQTTPTAQVAQANQSNPETQSNSTTPAPQASLFAPHWDESRIVVFLIGFCLLLESALIYYQAGPSQLVVMSITAISGVVLLFFAWLAPMEEDAIEPWENEPGADIGTDHYDGQRTHPPTAPSTEEKTSITPQAPPAGFPSTQSAPPEPVFQPQILDEGPPLSWYEKLKRGLAKTRNSFVGRLKDLVLGKTKIDPELHEELESLLFESDMGPQTGQEILNHLKERVAKEEIKDSKLIYTIIRDELRKKFTPFNFEPNFVKDGMSVFLVIGINGVGKTTTIAKLARHFIKEGKKVVLAAGDTFRAAAIDQISIWGQRVGAEVIKGSEGGDPGALVFDAIHAAKKRNADLLIIDTAGRMHVKANLMDELKKVKKIAEKESNGGPHEIFLVLDATTGQNAVQQAKLFNEALPISSLIMTKLDGTAKGGVIFAVQEQIKAPVKFIGVGEKMDDLMPFDPDQFLEALFSDEEKTKNSDYKVL